MRNNANHKITIRRVDDDNVSKERGTYDSVFGRNRTKRWVWTDFLSQATGLSRIKDVKGVADNQEKIRFTQIKDEEEIVKIEKEENSLLKEIKDSDAKLEDLFRDEKIVSEKLSDLMDKEKSVANRMVKLTEALESSSDLAVEVLAAMVIVPVLLV